MNNNGWITDRLPTEEDPLVNGRVLITVNGEVTLCYYNDVSGVPWQPIPLPAPYVKPKRWSVDLNHYCNCYVITDGEQCIQLHFNQCKDAAQRICDIYNEVMP